MISFIPGELLLPEVLNETIATYVVSLVILDMRNQEGAAKRIERNINRASAKDPPMKPVNEFPV